MNFDFSPVLPPVCARQAALKGERRKTGLFPLGSRVKTDGFFECVKVELITKMPLYLLFVNFRSKEKGKRNVG
jgi:hypothetical protein